MHRIEKNSKVVLLAPSGQIGSKDKIEKCINYLQSLGFEPVLGKNTLKQYRYMAGSDEERAADINEAFKNEEIKAIFCVRAAAGSLRILPYLNYDLIRQNPKPLIGFCDNAALFLAVYQKAGVCSWNGFSPTYDFRNENLDNLIKSSFENIIKEEKINIISGKCRIKGTAEGTLICSNLTTLLYLAGTEYFPDLSNKILLIEDVHERVHRIDMMLQQLKQQPDFNKLKGIILGKFTDISGDEEDGSIEDCFKDFLQNVNIPVIEDFDFGHIQSRYVLPIGAKIKLNSNNSQIILTDF